MPFRACPACGWKIPAHFALPADAQLAQQTVCPNDQCGRSLVRYRDEDGWGEWALAEASERDPTRDPVLRRVPEAP